jgi:hypothetical protein
VVAFIVANGWSRYRKENKSMPRRRKEWRAGIGIGIDDREVPHPDIYT